MQIIICVYLGELRTNYVRQSCNTRVGAPIQNKYNANGGGAPGENHNFALVNTF